MENDTPSFKTLEDLLNSYQMFNHNAIFPSHLFQFLSGVLMESNPPMWLLYTCMFFVYFLWHSVLVFFSLGIPFFDDYFDSSYSKTPFAFAELKTHQATFFTLIFISCCIAFEWVCYSHYFSTNHISCHRATFFQLLIFFGTQLFWPVVGVETGCLLATSLSLNNQSSVSIIYGILLVSVTIMFTLFNKYMSMYLHLVFHSVSQIIFPFTLLDNITIFLISAAIPFRIYSNQFLVLTISSIELIWGIGFFTTTKDVLVINIFTEFFTTKFNCEMILYSIIGISFYKKNIDLKTYVILSVIFEFLSIVIVIITIYARTYYYLKRNNFASLSHDQNEHREKHYGHFSLNILRLGIIYKDLKVFDKDFLNSIISETCDESTLQFVIGICISRNIPFSSINIPKTRVAYSIVPQLRFLLFHYQRYQAYLDGKAPPEIIQLFKIHNEQIQRYTESFVVLKEYTQENTLNKVSKSIQNSLKFLSNMAIFYSRSPEVRELYQQISQMWLFSPSSINYFPKIPGFDFYHSLKHNPLTFGMSESSYDTRPSSHNKTFRETFRHNSAPSIFPNLENINHSSLPINIISKKKRKPTPFAFETFINKLFTLDYKFSLFFYALYFCLLFVFGFFMNFSYIKSLNILTKIADDVYKGYRLDVYSAQKLYYSIDKSYEVIPVEYIKNLLNINDSLAASLHSSYSFDIENADYLTNTFNNSNFFFTEPFPEKCPNISYSILSLFYPTQTETSFSLYCYNALLTGYSDSFFNHTQESYLKLLPDIPYFTIYFFHGAVVIFIIFGFMLALYQRKKLKRIVDIENQFRNVSVIDQKITIDWFHSIPVWGIISLFGIVSATVFVCIFFVSLTNTWSNSKKELDQIGKFIEIFKNSFVCISFIEKIALMKDLYPNLTSFESLANDFHNSDISDEKDYEFFFKFYLSTIKTRSSEIIEDVNNISNEGILDTFASIPPLDSFYGPNPESLSTIMLEFSHIMKTIQPDPSGLQYLRARSIIFFNVSKILNSTIPKMIEATTFLFQSRSIKFWEITMTFTLILVLYVLFIYWILSRQSSFAFIIKFFLRYQIRHSLEIDPLQQPNSSKSNCIEQDKNNINSIRIGHVLIKQILDTWSGSSENPQNQAIEMFNFPCMIVDSSNPDSYQWIILAANNKITNFTCFTTQQLIGQSFGSIFGIFQEIKEYQSKIIFMDAIPWNENTHCANNLALIIILEITDYFKVKMEKEPILDRIKLNEIGIPYQGEFTYIAVEYKSFILQTGPNEKTVEPNGLIKVKFCDNCCHYIAFEKNYNDYVMFILKDIVSKFEEGNEGNAAITIGNGIITTIGGDSLETIISGKHVDKADREVFKYKMGSFYIDRSIFDQIENETKEFASIHNVLLIDF